MKKYLTVGQVAEELDVHPNTVRRWFDSGKLQPYRMGGRILALRSDVDEFIQPQPQEAVSGKVQEVGTPVLD